MKRFAAIALPLIIGAVCVHAQDIYLADPDIRAFVLANYDSDNNGSIDSGEALAVDSIWVEDTQVINLTGLEAFVNLGNLSIINAWDADLTGLGVTDLEPISALIQLYNLDLVNVPVGELSALENLVNVEYLNIGRYVPTDARVTNIEPLSYLISLVGVTLDGHAITDICPMGQLTQLEALEFNENQVSDVRCLSALTNLVEFEFSWNPISDISIIQNMPNLYFLNVQGCQIESITPLVANAGIGSGDYLYIGWNLLNWDDCDDIDEIQSRGPSEIHFSPQWNGPICEDAMIPDEERAALLALYQSTAGDSWHENSGWNGPQGSEASWFGVSVRDGHVTELHLPSNNLVGQLPNEIGDLSFLQELRVQNNDLSGGFPESFWDLSELISFVIERNPNFGGEIQPAIGNLSALRIFAANSAGLTGTLPNEIGTLPYLEYFLANWNNLKGSLPPDIATCANLYALDLFGNELTGPIPDSYRYLSNLTYFSLGNPGPGGRWRSEPQGLFPPWIGELKELKNLFLYSAGLTGEISHGICDLKNIEMLNLDFNHLTGTIPDCVTELPFMNFFSMCDNFLEGSIPIGLDRLTELEVVDLSGNRLSGSIPQGLADATRLKTLLLGRNRLTGQIPYGIGVQPNLDTLDVGDNRLSGPIPEDIGEAPIIRYLDLSKNGFDPGPIPSWMKNLTSLRWLYLDDSNRVGEIPFDFGDFPLLWALTLSDNDLIGEIPESMCGTSSMAWLDISDTELSGTIPDCFAEFSLLRTIRMERNRLSGPVPEGFSATASLKVFSLGGNMLSSLPSDIFDLRAQEEIWLGSNALPINNPEVNTSLNVLNPDISPYEATQTVAPTDLAVVATSVNAIELAWAPIPYQDYAGRYEVFATTDMSFELVGVTDDKTAPSIVIDGLEPATTYRFKIRTVTDPVTDSENIYHLNKNTVMSSFSGEVLGSTPSRESAATRFVTGSGWFDSPTGANPADPTATGKLHFTFKAEYKRDAAAPSGKTHINLKETDLDFWSTNLRWFFIDGVAARFSGTGEINGSGNYDFTVTASDGEPDQIRIEITEAATDTLVYDSGVTSSQTPLGGGSITIHAN